MKTALLALFLVVASIAQGQQATAPALISIDAKTLGAAIAESKGRVLVLNLWATWCKPCVEEFPELMKLQRSYGKKGLDVIFVSIDDDAKAKQKVTAFLRKMKVAGRSYIKQPGDDEAFINAVSSKWSGSLPATLIYDVNSRLTEMIGEQVNYFELEKIVLPLLPNHVPRTSH